MKFTRLQMAFCISLLVHSAIAGVVYVVQRNNLLARPFPVGDSPQVMELNVVEMENGTSPSGGTVVNQLQPIKERVPAQKPVEKATPEIVPPVQMPAYAADVPIPEDSEADFMDPQMETQEIAPTTTAVGQGSGASASSASSASRSPVRYFMNAKPLYPEKARKRGQQG